MADDPKAKLKFFWTGKEVDRAKKQRFLVELPDHDFHGIRDFDVVVEPANLCPFPSSLSEKYFHRRQDDLRLYHNPGALTTPFGVIPKLGIQIKTANGDIVTFDKCAKCQNQDRDCFPPDPRIAHKEQARFSYALIGSNLLQFKAGKVELPVCFRCVPSHQIPKGDNIILMQVGINFGHTVGTLVSDFIKVQYKKGVSQTMNKLNITPSPPQDLMEELRQKDLRIQQLLEENDRLRKENDVLKESFAALTKVESSELMMTDDEIDTLNSLGITPGFILQDSALMGGSLTISGRAPGADLGKSSSAIFQIKFTFLRAGGGEPIEVEEPGRGKFPTFYSGEKIGIRITNYNPIDVFIKVMYKDCKGFCEIIPLIPDSNHFLRIEGSGQPHNFILGELKLPPDYHGNAIETCSIVISTTPKPLDFKGTSKSAIISRSICLLPSPLKFGASPY